MDCCKQECQNCSSEDTHVDECYSDGVEIGKAVPDLTFDVYQQNEIKKGVSLKDYRGKWLILFFYPADFTFICPTELEELADSYAQFQTLGAEVVSISTDTVYCHKAWQDCSPAIKKITFGMAADPTGTLCQVFGTYIDEEGISLRGTFLIDPQGILIAQEMNDNSIGRSAKELLRKLQAAQFVAKNPGQVCPASWEPGKATLKPGLDLVGKI